MQGRHLMNRMLLSALAAVACAGPVRAQTASADPAGVEFFEKNIRPVLSEKCYACHSGQAKTLKGNLRLDSWEGISKGGDSGNPAIVAGNAEKSPLLTAIRYTDKGSGDHDPLLMPPKKGGKEQKLADAVIDDFQQWIAAGAPHPASFEKPPAEVAIAATAKGKDHWAFKKPVAVDPPARSRRTRRRGGCRRSPRVRAPWTRSARPGT